MKKFLKNKVIITLITIILMVSAANYVLYGTFNPLNEPKRVFIDGYMYYNTNFYISQADGKSPNKEVSRSIDKITNNRFFKGIENIKHDEVILYRLTGHRTHGMRYVDNLYIEFRRR